MPSNNAEDVYFYGHNWEDLDRLVALSYFHFSANNEYDVVAEDGTPLNAGEVARSGYLASFFRGPALDWVAANRTVPGTMAPFTAFVIAVKQHFGVSDETTQIVRRGELDRLKWGNDVSVFFAEFDRLTSLLGITAAEAKITHVLARVPPHVNKLLAEQALVFNDYGTMRARLITMWALGAFGAPKSTVTCSKCGKKGHATSDCRGGSSKN